jgi:hypothetical protein
MQNSETLSHCLERVYADLAKPQQEFAQFSFNLTVEVHLSGSLALLLSSIAPLAAKAA